MLFADGGYESKLIPTHTVTWHCDGYHRWKEINEDKWRVLEVMMVTMQTQTEYLQVRWTMATTYALLMARLFSR